jgi:putative SOS response-associated peptidase YedK
MSTRYESVHIASLYPDAFHVAAPACDLGRDVWPRQPGVFIRAAQAEDAEDAADADKPPRALPSRELVTGQFGLVPRWVKSASDAKLRSTKLVNARSETVTTSNNFRDAWLGGQRCVVPMMAFMEDDWRSGKAVPTRIARVDGKPMGVAGLWEAWTGADGDVIISFTLLTVNANSHAVMSRYQQPGNEKRMMAILNEGAADAWLSARPEKAREFMRAYPANWLIASPVEKSR